MKLGRQKTGIRIRFSKDRTQRRVIDCQKKAGLEASIKNIEQREEKDKQIKKKVEQIVEKDREKEKEIDNFMKDSPPTTAASANQAAENQSNSQHTPD